MGENKVIVRLTESGNVVIDIPGTGNQCEVKLDDILSNIDGIVPEGEMIKHTPKEKDVLEVNVGYDG